MTKKIIIAFLSVLPALLATQCVAYAVTGNVVYDAAAGTLSVSGACSARFVLVIVRKASDSSIWGSSNPSCVNNSYQYEQDVPDADRTGSAFTVQVYDQASAGGGVPATAGGATGAGAQTVVFAPPPPAPLSPPATDSISLTIDTSSLTVANTDQSFLDSALSQFFGIITDAAAAIQNFSFIVADTVKSSLVATISLFSKTITVLPGGSVTVPRGQDQISGTGSLAAGASEVFIPNTSVTSSSQIIVTPTSASQVPLAVVQVVDGSGFDVGTISPQQIAISFTWFIVGTYNVGPPTSVGLQGTSQQQSSGQAQGSSQVQDAPAPPIPPANGADSSTSATIDATGTTDIASTTDAGNVATTTDTSTTTDVTSTTP